MAVVRRSHIQIVPVKRISTTMTVQNIIWIFIVISGAVISNGFSIARLSDLPRRSSSLPMAAVDPSSFVHTPVDLSNSAIDSVQHAEALISTIYSSGVAHGHSNPWFGPPDPYLEAGRSIAPLKPVTDPSAAPNVPEIVQELVAKGLKVIDASGIKEQDYLPGFVPPSNSFISRDAIPVAPESLPGFLAKAEWASSFSNVLDKLALASFVYCLVEFFYLRPNIDLYKSEIEEESQATLWADVVATFSVRFVAMAFVALFTLAIFQ